MYWFALIALLCASVTDLRRREIPDAVPLGLLAAALIAKVIGWEGAASWGAMGLGFLCAFVAGAVLFRMGGLGGGDVKLFASLGAALGLGAFVPFAILTSIVGGGVGLWARRRQIQEIAYAPVMLAGLLGLLPLTWCLPS